MSTAPTECVFLVADNSMEAAFETFLGDGGAFPKLATRPFAYRIINVPGENDSDLCFEPDRVLSEQGVVPDPDTRLVVVFDQKYNRVPPADESRVKSSQRLKHAGWQPGQFHVTVISPELEAWMWHDADAPMRVVEDAFRYDRVKRGGPLRDRLAQQDQWPVGVPKPPRPKAAFEWTSQQFKGVSIQITVREIVARVGITHCQDAAFQELREVLASWFPPAWLEQASQPQTP